MVRHCHVQQNKNNQVIRTFDLLYNFLIITQPELEKERHDKP